MLRGIKGLSINISDIKIGPLGGRTFRLPALGIGLVLVLLLLSAGVVIYWNKIPQIDWRVLLGKLAIEKPTEKAEVPGSEEVFVAEEVLTVTPGKVYEKTAQPGEGITHLARRSLKSYLEEKGSDLNLSPEHKVYIEDYIKDKTGERWLILGETLTFSEELIVEAINKARQLSPNQLENLKQYSQMVSSF